MFISNADYIKMTLFCMLIAATTGATIGLIEVLFFS